MASQFYRSGYLTTDTVTDPIMLKARVTTSGRVSTFRLNTGTAGYAVTTGKTFYITGIKVATSDSAAANNGVAIGYSDTDLGYDSAVARTNPVNVLGEPENATAITLGGIQFNPSVAEHRNNIQTGYQNIFIKSAPAGKYFYMKAIGIATDVEVQLWGFEK